MKAWHKIVLIGLGGLGGFKAADLMLKLLPKTTPVDDYATTTHETIRLVIWIAEKGILMEHEDFVREFIERFEFIKLQHNFDNPNPIG